MHAVKGSSRLALVDLLAGLTGSQGYPRCCPGKHRSVRCSILWTDAADRGDLLRSVAPLIHTYSSICQCRNSNTSVGIQADPLPSVFALLSLIVVSQLIVRQSVDTGRRNVLFCCPKIFWSSSESVTFYVCTLLWMLCISGAECQLRPAQVTDEAWSTGGRCISLFWSWLFCLRTWAGRVLS